MCCVLSVVCCVCVVLLDAFSVCVCRVLCAHVGVDVVVVLLWSLLLVVALLLLLFTVVVVVVGEYV